MDYGEKLLHIFNFRPDYQRLSPRVNDIRNIKFADNRRGDMEN